MKNFTLKFIDIMIGIILGLGFQWWPELHEPWHYVAFFFACFSIIDYWIDYVPALKKFPPKTELTLIADFGVLFMMFLLVYATQFTAAYFLTVFAIYRFIDLIWIARVRYEYRISPPDTIFFRTWFRFEVVEGLTALILAAASYYGLLTPLVAVSLFIVFRIFMRVLASWQYKRVHFA
jgi:hypothetical protein